VSKGDAGPIQAKDIPDEAFMAAVEKCGRDNPAQWAMRWDVTAELGVPWKVAIAKFKRLEAKGLLSGCSCGCRGDWHRPNGTYGPNDVARKP
jgi:hypothetical protein